MKNGATSLLANPNKVQKVSGDGTPADAIENLLGITPTPLIGNYRRNIDLHEGTPHTSTGLAYAIDGTASVVQVKVGEYLAKFQDPIKAILTTEGSLAA
ncbi:MAG: hypothetical protein VW104_02200 [Halieaceae bacterium]